MDRRLLNRRHFLIGAGGAVSGLTLTEAAFGTTSVNLEPPFSAGVNSFCFGVVERIEPPRLYLLGDDGPKTIEFQDGAVFQRDHVVGLADFLPGDEVVVEGEWMSGIFAGTALTTVLSIREGAIIAVAADRVVTSGGTVSITSDTRYFARDAWRRERPTYISAPTRITALGRQEPDGDFVGLMISQASE
jgi:hypothetical protein